LYVTDGAVFVGLGASNGLPCFGFHVCGTFPSPILRAATVTDAITATANPTPDRIVLSDLFARPRRDVRSGRVTSSSSVVAVIVVISFPSSRPPVARPAVVVIDVATKLVSLSLSVCVSPR
jgi:hypothetical protein